MNYYCDKEGNIYNANGKLMKQQLHKKGYMYFTEHNVKKYPKRKKKTWRVNRFIYQYWNPDVDMTNMDVDHKNDIRTDNRLENLELVTKKENNRRRRYVKLDMYKAAMIRTLYAQGDTSYRKLADKFDVHFSVIADIINKKIWV